MNVLFSSSHKVIVWLQKTEYRAWNIHFMILHYTWKQLQLHGKVWSVYYLNFFFTVKNSYRIETTCGWGWVNDYRWYTLIAYPILYMYVYVYDAYVAA